MKNTLLALMLVSSLFVISCGADATKPGDAYKNQTAETETGTETYYNAAVTADVNGGANIVDLTSFMTAGVKVTEIVQIVTVTTGTTGNTIKTTNAVTGTTKNADGGIYKFTTDAAVTAGSDKVWVTYKYIKREAAPMVEKEAAGTYSSTGSTLTMNASFTDEEKSFNKNVVSVTDKNGKQLIEYKDYNYDRYADTINIINTITGTTPTYNDGDKFTVKYTYRDISMISEKPLTDNVTVDQQTKTKATITLDAAAYAGRSCYVKAPLTWQQQGSGGGSGITEATIYYNIVIPSTGIITINAPATWTEITSGTYEIWVY